MVTTKKVRSKHKPRLGVIDVLYRAVAKYVESNGGRVIVAGGIQCQQWPGDGLYQFTIAVKCTGRPPKFAKLEHPNG